ncbi:MAG: molybdenum cofactor guanylyltransferase [Leptospirales bacterium]
MFTRKFSGRPRKPGSDTARTFSCPQNDRRWWALSIVESNSLLALVLCGGKSVRMNRDKGLLSLNGEPQFLNAARILSGVFSSVPSKVVPEVAVSVRSEQISSYKNALHDAVCAATVDAKIPRITFITDSDNIKIGGPLKGILSAHEKHPEKDLLVLAVDYFSMLTAPLSVLMELYTENRNTKENNYDAICWAINKRPEPLCAIYTASFLSHIYTEITSKKNTLDSARQWLLKGRTLLKEVPPELISAFKNYNYAQDLAIHKK